MAEPTVEFEDNTIKVLNALDNAYIAWLYEAAGELEAQAKRNTKVGKISGGKTKGKWKYEVDESSKEAVVGNTEETSIWLEFGTGEYALNGDGRKGGWYIPIGNGQGQISEEVVKAYHFKTAYGKDGKKYAYTTGMKPQRPLYTAFTNCKTKIQKAFAEKMKELNKNP